jgi:hypothetical protein
MNITKTQLKIKKLTEMNRNSIKVYTQQQQAYKKDQPH